MFKFGDKVVSLVKETEGDKGLDIGMLGVVVEVNSNGTYDIYFIGAEGKLRTLSANEFNKEYK